MSIGPAVSRLAWVHFPAVCVVPPVVTASAAGGAAAAGRGCVLHACLRVRPLAVAIAAGRAVAAPRNKRLHGSGNYPVVGGVALHHSADSSGMLLVCHHSGIRRIWLIRLIKLWHKLVHLNWLARERGGSVRLHGYPSMRLIKLWYTGINLSLELLVPSILG